MSDFQSSYNMGVLPVACSVIIAAAMGALWLIHQESIVVTCLSLIFLLWSNRMQDEAVMLRKFLNEKEKTKPAI
jgi:hypothetical protein